MLSWTFANLGYGRPASSPRTVSVSQYVLQSNALDPESVEILGGANLKHKEEAVCVYSREFGPSLSSIYEHELSLVSLDVSQVF